MDSSVYNDKFYTLQSSGSARSAEVIVPMLMDLVAPKSVIDIGCGAGRWLQEFERLGVNDIYGIDGSQGAQDAHDLRNDQFGEHDLLRPLELERKFDLAVSLEVAEHLPESRAESFVADLTNCAEVILFSAAIPYQGGIHHVCEKWQSYWASLFNKMGYQAIDAIRPRVWVIEGVQWWYAQNTLLYASDDELNSNRVLRNAYERSGDMPLDIIHPTKYLHEADPENVSLRRVLTLFNKVIRRNLSVLKKNNL